MGKRGNLAAIWSGIGVFAAVGVFCMVAGGRQIAQGLASGRWPSAPGVVVSSQVTSSTGPSGTGPSTSTTYAPNVVYRYTLAGSEREGTRIRFGAVGGGEDWALAYVARYPAGAAVDVYYDPADPATTILETGVTTRAILFFLAGLPCLGMSVLFYRVRGSV